MTNVPTLTDIIEAALSRPLHAVSYSFRLAIEQRFVDRFVLESEDADFEIEGFANAGHCRFEPREDIVLRRLHRWSDHAWAHAPIGAWNVHWEEDGVTHRFDYVVAEWSEAGCHAKTRFVAAESRTAAEAFFTAVCRWSSDLAGAVLVFDRGHWDKNRGLYVDIRKTRLDELILPGQLRDEIVGDLQRFIDRKAEYDEFGIPWKRGILLAGPPGNGKTMCIKALANSLRVAQVDGSATPIDCLYVRSLAHPQIPDHYTIGEVFDRARRSTPCLLIFEDVDALVTDENRSVFLNELDGLATNSGIITIASTNHAERLDPALRNRPSRFDRSWQFGLPAEPERSRYLTSWNQRSAARVRLDETGCARVAAQTDGFSYAYLKELMISSLMRWIDGGPERATLADVVAQQVAILREQMAESVVPPGQAGPQDGQPSPSRRRVSR